MTGLRFLAAISIAIPHGFLVTRLTDLPQFAWIQNGPYFGMPLFFVLSGFVIHYNYRIIVTEGGMQGVSTFLWARFARLYPLFLAFLLVDYILGFEIIRWVANDPNPKFPRTMEVLPYYLTMTQAWFYSPGPKFSLIFELGHAMQVAWSISTEWFFYLAYPLFAAAVLRIRSLRAGLIVAAAFSVVWGVLWIAIVNREPAIDAWAVSVWGSIAGRANGYQDCFFRWLVYFSPYARIGEFIMGCITAQVYLALSQRRVSGWERIIGLAALILSAVSIPLIIWSYTNQGFLSPLRNSFALAPSIAVLIFCVARYRSVIADVLSSRPMVGLGNASYSIYLFHFVPLHTIAALHLHQFSDQTAGMWVLLLRLAGWLTLVFVISLGLYRVIEVPAQRWLRSLPNRLFGPTLRGSELRS